MLKFLFTLLNNTRCKSKCIKIHYPDKGSRYTLHVNTSCKRALSLVFPSIRSSLEQIPSLWFWFVSAWYAVWTVTNRMLLVVRVKATHTHTQVSKSPLSFSQFIPSSFPAIRLILHSSSRLSPSCVCPHMTLCTRLFTLVHFSIPPSLFLPRTIGSCSVSFLTLHRPFRPVRFSLCVSAAHSVTPITPSLPLSALHTHFFLLSCIPSHLCHSLLSFTFILSSSLFFFLHPSTHSLRPVSVLYLTFASSTSAHASSFLCLTFTPSICPLLSCFLVALCHHLCPPCFYVSLQAADKMKISS